MQCVGARGPHMTMGTARELPDVIFDDALTFKLRVELYFLRLCLLERDIFDANGDIIVLCNEPFRSDDY